MKKLHFIPMCSLQIFAEGTGGGDGGTAEGSGVNGAVAASQNPGAKGNPLANVKYGIQEESVPAAEVTQAPPDPSKEFEALIKGQYKDQFDARVQDILQKRLKGSKEMESKYNAQLPIMELLAKKYGLKDASDSEALAKAIEEDDSFFEEEAMKRGLTVQQYKEIRAMERENANLRRQMQESERKENANKLYAQWMNQAEELKKVYSNFDLRSEMENQQFLSLLRSGIDMKTAFEVLHKDELIPAAMQMAVKSATQSVVNSVISGRSRPSENGNSGQGAVLTKSDVSKLSRADRDEIRRRVARGEKIRF